MNILIRLFSYLCDSAFAFTYLRGPSGKPRFLQGGLMSVVLLLALFFLYYSKSPLFLANSLVRYLFRILLHAGLVLCCRRLSPSHIAYVSFFWGAVYLFSHNVFFTPVSYSLLSGNVHFFETSAANGIFCAVTVIIYKSICYLLVLHFLPTRHPENIDRLHVLMLSILTLSGLFIKQLEKPLVESEHTFSIELSVFFITLQWALLFLLIAFECYQYQLQESAAFRTQAFSAQMLLKGIQDKQENDETLRRLRHDLKNHMLTIRLLLEKQNIDGAIQYTDQFLSQMTPCHQSYHTGNALVDGLLAEKLSGPQSDGVKTNVVLDFSKGSFLSDFDICVIMGNLLDNASESCSQLTADQERFISISGGVTANCLLVRIENSCISPPHFSYGLPQTHKKNRSAHGYGLRNVQQVLQRYHGNLSFALEDNRFILSLLIPIPQDILSENPGCVASASDLFTT